MQPAPGWVPPPPAARRAPSRAPVRWSLVLGGGLAGLLLVALLAHRPLLRWVIERQASSLGLSLRFDELSVGFGTVSVTGARFGLLGQKLLVGEAETLEFEPSLFRASRVTARKGRIVVVGPIRTALEGVSRWRSEHGKSTGIEVACRDTSIELRDEATSPPWLLVSGASATPSGRGGLLRSAGVSVFGVGVGPVSVGWMSRSQGLSLWLGEAGESASHSRLELLSSSTPTVRVTLQAAPLASLAQPLGLPSTVTAALDAQAELAFPAGQGLIGKMNGTARGVRVAGAEWSGLTLGPVTFGSRILGTPDASRVVFDGMTVQSGGMTMQGGIDWTRQPVGGILRGQLAGAVPCGMLVGNAVAAGVGGALGNLAGTVAGAAVGGQVTISVAFQFDTRAPQAGTVTPQVGVGCNLLGF
jgi:hypothetical protein